MQQTPGTATGRVRLFGQAHSAEAYQIRDLLTRSVVGFDWVELTCDEECGRELGLPDLANTRLPVVELPDGSRLFAPTLRELAAKLGWVTQPRLREYDLSIYGAGPAGLSAAVYAASEGLRAVVIERHAVGGQAGSSSMIENYMGFPQGIAGAELAERARQQAVKFGIELLMMQEGVRGTPATTASGWTWLTDPRWWRRPTSAPPASSGAALTCQVRTACSGQASTTALA